MRATWSWRAIILAAGIVASGLLGGAFVWADDDDEPLEAAPVLSEDEQRLREELLGQPALIARTQREVNQHHLKFFRRFTLGMYEQFGRKSADWDEPAGELLELFARHLATSGDAPAAKEFRAAAQPLMNAKCDDPMVCAAIAAALWGVNDWYEATNYFQKALAWDQQQEGQTWEQLLDAHQPPLQDYTWMLKWYAYVALGDMFDDLGGDYQRQVPGIRVSAVDFYSRALEEDWFAPGDERILYEWLRPHLVGALSKYADVAIRRVSRLRRCHPWLQEMILGRGHVILAWQARGSGWLSTVTPQGAEGFDEHLALAREHLVTAWGMRPDYPAAPAAIISIEKGRGSREDLYLWFDRTVAAQFDYSPVYHAMLAALQPRWGGNHQDMLRFGEECLDTGRFDTMVPSMYWHVVHTMGEDVYEQMPGIWREADVYRNMHGMFEGMLGDPDYPRSPVLTKTHWAAVAWRSGRLDKARELLEELGDDAVDDVFEKLYRTSAVRARGQIMWRTGPAGEQIEEALALGREEPAATAAAIEEMIGKAGGDDADGGLRCLLVDLGVREALASGEWHDIMPGKDLVGWHAATGEWRYTPDRHISAMNEEADAQLILDQPVDGNVEIECEVRLHGRDHAGVAGILFGVRQTSPEARKWFECCFQLVGSVDKAYLSGSQLEKVFSVPVDDVQSSVHLRVQIWEDRITCYLDDEPVYRNVQLQPPAQPGIPAHIGIGHTYQRKPGRMAIYYSVRMRRLTEPPDWYVVH